MAVLNPSLAQGKRKFLFRLFCQVGQASLQGSGKKHFNSSVAFGIFLKFDSRKAAFWLKRAVLGIKFPMCIHSPSTIPLEI